MTTAAKQSTTKPHACHEENQHHRHHHDDDIESTNNDNKKQEHHDDGPHPTKDFQTPTKTTSTMTFWKKYARSPMIGLILLLGLIIAALASSQSLRKTPQPITEAPTSAPSASPTRGPISLQEVALHNTPDDCWVAFYGHVYNMTEWAILHPGGSARIYSVAGTDGTAVFSGFHTEYKLLFVQHYKLGVLME